MPFLGDEAYTQRVVQLALDNVRAGGRPFACLIVNRETGEVLAEAANKVRRGRARPPLRGRNCCSALR